MTRHVFAWLSAAGAAAVIALGSGATLVAGQAATGGTIVGHVRYMGPTPVNPIIRMGADPKCNKLYVGKRLTAPAFVVAADGGMANVFVNVDGSFPATPVPSAAVVITQRGCVYEPHVVGARVGQTLQIMNDDDTGHNLHSASIAGNGFNTSQPTKGMVFNYTLKAQVLPRRVSHPNRNAQLARLIRIGGELASVEASLLQLDARRGAETAPLGDRD